MLFFDQCSKREACLYLYEDDPDKGLYKRLAYDLLKDLYGDLDNYMLMEGPRWGTQWLSYSGRNNLIVSLLFAYEYVVTEMQGVRSEFDQL